MLAQKLSKSIFAVLFAVVLGGAGAPTEPPRELQWANLVPPAPPGPPKLLFGRGSDSGGIIGGGPGEAASPQQPEGRWMSGIGKPAGPAPVLQSLDGQRVHIGGYVVPLSFDATTVTEFLLVPYVGACIHVPPPPTNQIIYVKSEKGITLKGEFDPVYVTGTLKVVPAFTGLADTGYSLDATAVEMRSTK